MDIGPQTFLDDANCAPCYQYSVVSNEFGLDLYVLARDPALFYQEFNSTLYQTLIDQGFTHDYNRPLVRILQHHMTSSNPSHPLQETYQSDKCEYAPLPGEEE